MPSSLTFSHASRAVVVGLGLASAAWLTHAANLYAPDTKTLSVPVVNVPGLGSFDAQLVSTGSSALPQAGTVFKLTRLVSSREPSSQPAGYLFSDETVILPAVAVRAADGTISYFDVKLRNISGASADTFVVDSIQDTILGRPGGAAGPKGEKGDKGDTGERGAQGPAGAAGAPGAPGVAGPQGIAGKDGAAGPAGINGSNGADGINGKTLLNGNADPAPSEGSDGDFYLNRVTSTLFGPKAANAWPTGGTSLKGPPGTQGVQGETGPKGDAGTAGPTGVKGDTGPQGAPGPKGDTGATGAPGSPGLQGPPGTQGIQGTPGPAGAIGPAGSAGPIGPQGPQGPKGDSASSKTVHGCFNGAAASASGAGYTATRTNNSYSLSFTGLTMSSTNYTLLIDARTSAGRAWAIGAVKVTNGMTLTGGWLDSAETLGQICFLATE